MLTEVSSARKQKGATEARNRSICMLRKDRLLGKQVKRLVRADGQGTMHCGPPIVARRWRPKHDKEVLSPRTAGCILAVDIPIGLF